VFLIAVMCWCCRQ